MKKVTTWLTLLATVAVVFVGCKKDDKQIYFEGGNPPVLKASTANVVLAPEIADNEAILFDWTNPAYSFTTGISSHDVTYTLEIDKQGQNFASPGKKQVEIKKELKRSFTVNEINNILLIDLEQPVGVEQSLEARLVASI
jgi:hypothetical protein